MPWIYSSRTESSSKLNKALVLILIYFTLQHLQTMSFTALMKYFLL